MARIREYVQKSCKGVISQVQKNLTSFLKESCREFWSAQQTIFAWKWDKSEVFCQNLPRPCISCTFCLILAILFKNSALFCKRLPRILQLLSDRLFTKTKSLCSFERNQPHKNESPSSFALWVTYSKDKLLTIFKYLNAGMLLRKDGESRKSKIS